MSWARTRYGLPVIFYNWAVGLLGLLLLLYYSLASPFSIGSLPLTALLLFLSMHLLASLLHFPYLRLNVIITLDAAFTTAILLVSGTLPAIWISLVGISLASLKRVAHRRMVLHRINPLPYDAGIIIFNMGMACMMWLAAGAAYSILGGDLPLQQFEVRHIRSLLAMFLAVSLVNHLALTMNSFFQGLHIRTFLKKGVIPAFAAEATILPFGILMALAYNRIGIVAFLFLGCTLLLFNLVLRHLNTVKNDLEEKIRQLTGLNTISRQVISLRDEDAVMRLLFREITKIIDSGSLFLAAANGQGHEFEITEPDAERKAVLQRLAVMTATKREPLFIRNAKKDAPEEWRDECLQNSIEACMAIPLLSGNKVYGVVGVYSKEAHSFKADHLQILRMIADLTALALENSRLYSALTDQVSELERLNKELRQLDRLKSEFLANVSHELRTPLTSIKGYVDYIRKEKLGPITPLQNEGLTVAQRNISRLQRLIDDLLDYTRLEFKKSPLVLDSCPFEKIWTSAYDEHAESLVRKKLSLHVSIPPDLPLLFVDSHKVSQVMSNLLSNAIKFTPDAGVIRLEARKLPGHHAFYQQELYKTNCMVEALVPVEITLSDTGVGIPGEALAKIFERFYQVDSSNTRKYGGTGLGLAIVKSILTAHGANIEVESVLGEGTVLRIVIAGMEPGDLPACIKPPQIEDPASQKYLV